MASKLFRQQPQWLRRPILLNLIPVSAEISIESAALNQCRRFKYPWGNSRISARSRIAESRHPVQRPLLGRAQMADRRTCARPGPRRLCEQQDRTVDASLRCAKKR